VARRSLPWEYKSLLEYGEENFARGDIGVTFRFNLDNFRGWHGLAAKALGEEVTRNVLCEDGGHGLILYVREGSNFRPAIHGDAPYDFAKRICLDGNLSDIAIDKPPSWANELFVCRSNLDAYACIFDTHDLSDPKFDVGNKVRRDAVWLETLRRMGVSPYADLTVPSPETWSDMSSVADQCCEPATPLATKERNCLLKLVIGMAVIGYKYDPASKKSLVTKEIADDLASLGISIDSDTVRKYLKEAANTVLPVIARKP
jgi:hypothetical protein